MSRQITAHLLPTLFQPDDLRGGIAVVIDVLRATTTLAHGFQNGMAAMYPCETIDDAIAYREEHGPEILLGGERGGEPIEGFDLSNSPHEWNHETVSGRTVAFTTSNGTRALLRSAEADCVVTGAFANLSAVVRFLEASDLPVHLVCAGTNGHIATEDVLFAGAVVERLTAGGNFALNDAAQIAQNHWRSASQGEDALFSALSTGIGGQNVLRLKLDADMWVAATIDPVDLVPEFSPQSRLLRPAE
ncbi:2-phosphosulfolactate phosphatase [bacterium]|nr:2-phosphosulfolactate phosphatase [bacterium]